MSPVPMAASSDSGRDQDDEIGLFATPNEILDDIVCYLDPTDQRTVMSTCLLLHGLASRRLYRHIDVSSEIRGNSLLHTLIHSKSGYAAHTRSLHYGGDETYYTYTFHRLLAKALHRLTGLIHLSLQVQSTAFFTAFSIKKAIGSEKPVNTRPLSANLKSFQLYGDIRLIDIGALHTITKMTIADKISQVDLEILLDTIAPVGQNAILIELNLTLERSEDGRDVISTIYQVDRRCPNIEILGLRAPLVNSLDATRVLTLKPAILPKLSRLTVNTVSILFPFFHEGTQQILLKEQEDHLVEASFLRPGLINVRFGMIQWSREASSNTNTWRMSATRNGLLEFTDSMRFPKGYTGVPHIFWTVQYTSSQST